MIKLISTNLDGLFASPIRHPVTCANPSPWLIEKIKIESSSGERHTIWIRNHESMWFHLDQCYVGSKHELESINGHA